LAGNSVQPEKKRRSIESARCKREEGVEAIPPSLRNPKDQKTEEKRNVVKKGEGGELTPRSWQRSGEKTQSWQSLKQQGEEERRWALHFRNPTKSQFDFKGGNKQVEKKGACPHDFYAALGRKFTARGRGKKVKPAFSHSTRSQDDRRGEKKNSRKTRGAARVQKI